MDMPKISVVIPTYNRAKELTECLFALNSQNYPKDKLEVLVVDGFSTDNTKNIAKQHGAIVLDNPEVIHPRGRPLGIKQATGEIILCLDSDNILSDKYFLSKMIVPFLDPEVVAAEPLYYSARDEDNFITKYCALIGGDDPIVVLLGFNERYSYLTGRWTGVPHTEERKNGWLRIKFIDPVSIPSLGANGFMVRKNILMSIEFDPFHHINVSQKIIKSGGDIWGKVDTGLIHKHGNGIIKFIQKKIRRAERRMDKTVTMGYSYPISTISLSKIAIKAIFVLPVFFDALRGWCRKKNCVWFFHPIAFYGVFFIYAWTVIYRLFKKSVNTDYEKA